jgi:serine/threonine protein phosphatase PrpC
MSLRIAHAVGVERGEDRFLVVEQPTGAVIVVVDGAGGTVRAAAAAQSVVDAAVSARPSFDPVELLCACGCWLSMLGGQCAAVVARIDGNEVVGASIGDSAAWLVDDESSTELTSEQVRKPLLGSPDAEVVPFRASFIDGTLLIATDGLWNYVPPYAIKTLAASEPLDRVPERLLDAARLRSGALRDDTTIIAIRQTSPSKMAG